MSETPKPNKHTLVTFRVQSYISKRLDEIASMYGISKSQLIRSLINALYIALEQAECRDPISCRISIIVTDTKTGQQAITTIVF